MKVIDILNRRFKRFIIYLGSISMMFADTLRYLITNPPKKDVIYDQMYKIGVMSLPVVLLTGCATGMILAVQTYYQLHQLTIDTVVGIIVGLSMTNELGPVLTGLMVAGRVGAAMAAELGTMRVTEQIDALYTLATSPVKYLIVPRFVASILLIPVLTICSIFIGIIGGYIIGVELLGINSTFFIKNMRDFTEVTDLANGIIKSIFFSLIIVMVGCYKGFNADGGAEGVGKATTESVVVSCISILIADFFLSIILF
jgi:phospholipid/cholesterol/gamma-HCH transport system permease protein